MRRNTLYELPVKYDISVRFLDSDFLIGSEISAIWGRFQLIFSTKKLKVRYIYFTYWLNLTWVHVRLKSESAARNVVTEAPRSNFVRISREYQVLALRWQIALMGMVRVTWPVFKYCPDGIFWIADACYITPKRDEFGVTWTVSILGNKW